MLKIPELLNRMYKSIRKEPSWDELLQQYRTEQSKKRLEMIGEFIERERLCPRVYKKRGKTVMFLDRKDAGGIGEREITSLISQHMIAERMGISNNCFDIANEACVAGVATGRVCADEGTSNFTGWGNHCINFTELENDTVVAFDLTASHNIDCHQGRFDILCLKADNLDILLNKLGNLYGGDWKVIQID